MTPDPTHNHETPHPTKPWWTWACPTCTPRQYDQLTRPTHAESHRNTAECAFCLHSIPTPGGVLRPHKSDDAGAPCRGSGLTPTGARHLIDRILRHRRTGNNQHARAIPAAETTPVTIRIPPPPDEDAETQQRIETDLENIARTLMRARHNSNLTQKDLAALLRASDSTVSEWERGRHPPRPRRLIQWANAVGATIQITKNDTRHTVNTLTEVAQTLRDIRIKQRKTLEQTARRILHTVNIDHPPPRTLQRWENGTRNPLRVETLASWTIALGHTLTATENP